MIKYLIMDVDGTLTDGKIYMGSNGEMFKAFDIKDGCGIKDILPDYSIIPIIITARGSKILENRCKELAIEKLYQGERNKIGRLQQILKEENANLSNCAYIGDDILDIQCMTPIKEAGGLVGCPADAVQKVKNIADFISTRNGGNGAVREFIEWLLK
ncbi:HAD hydrolase family protein [uncultured Treponema sp.]|uniref:KdsC family phosphatase n=1 Tax=uncultured Treponema sp. TaxID=162155 RepID=UPI00280B290D|nr:HAD hydrolase family protein [uncultured Treponema sp.]